MLTHGLVHLPGAAQTSTEFHKIPCTKANGFSVLWRHGYITREQQAALTLVVLPREGTDLTAPDGPLAHLKRINLLLRASAGDLNQSQLARATVTVSRSSPELYISIMMSEPPRNSPLRYTWGMVGQLENSLIP